MQVSDGSVKLHELHTTLCIITVVIVDRCSNRYCPIYNIIIILLTDNIIMLFYCIPLYNLRLCCLWIY